VELGFGAGGLAQTIGGRFGEEYPTAADSKRSLIQRILYPGSANYWEHKYEKLTWRSPNTC